MSAPTLEIFEAGDAALRAVATSSDVEANWTAVHSLAAWLRTAAVEGIYGAVPTYDSVLVEFDPYVTSARQVRAFVQLGMRQLEYAGTALRRPRRFDVPVVYGGDCGPDLERVAEHQGLEVADVIARHTEKTYIIRCLGAPAGSPMMDGPDFPLPVPRLKDPRLSVPAGAVSVAGRQAVIAPAVAPGGWCVIGQTPLTVLDASREPLVPYVPGDELRFHQIPEEDFTRFAGQFLEARP
ncbi:KipI family sensor histidine kinase inhibitor [Arthrobacter ulcerisalmonis]|uniref:5-oxoprolinase subunit B family protein n=1 Tax=Arthrobacter sp. B1I2 TaxID=3042263 RepID=UPI00277DD666|nr:MULTISPECIES: carboxyltransferase domain-containing protein [Arthrobacter]MDQ0664470.1 KipI family sensor histidine kinase inhibitor [Arthrobacter ulcerisalmonis]MDQ0732387.1 KipI family sensor histidine kinase inhibitor [Arthrobacter sp. B1I2]